MTADDRRAPSEDKAILAPQEVALRRLVAAWTKAGYPVEYMPKQQFAKVAEAVLSAFEEGEEDFLREGWAKAGVDFPFAPAHPRYEAMKVAYEELGE